MSKNGVKCQSVFPNARDDVKMSLHSAKSQRHSGYLLSLRTKDYRKLSRLISYDRGFFSLVNLYNCLSKSQYNTETQYNTALPEQIHDTKICFNPTLTAPLVCCLSLHKYMWRAIHLVWSDLIWWTQYNNTTLTARKCLLPLERIHSHCRGFVQSCYKWTLSWTIQHTNTDTTTLQIGPVKELVDPVHSQAWDWTLNFKQQHRILRLSIHGDPKKQPGGGGHFCNQWKHGVYEKVLLYIASVEPTI